MPTCPDCGVELAEDARSCPLCGKPLGDARPHAHEKYIDPEDRERLTERERRTIAWEVLSVSSAIAAVAVLAVNLIDSGALTWALYPLFCLAFAWTVFTGVFLLYRKPLLAILFPALALHAFLVGLDLVDGRLSWALPLALPIALDAELSAAAAYLLSRVSKRKGANLIALALLAVVTLCIGVESTLDNFLSGRVALSWSAIVAFTLVPIACFLFYLHYRVGKKTNLRKLFRL